MARTPVALSLALALAVALALAGCGGGEEVSPAPQTVEGTLAQEQTSTAELPKGDAAAGKEVFVSTGCGGCHTYAEAGTTGQIGPNLDDGLAGKDAAFIHESIVDPNAEVAEGFQPGVMPQTYGDQLSDQQLADLVAFLTPS
jgi:mono/diheme cytochrome c family protein